MIRQHATHEEFKATLKEANKLRNDFVLVATAAEMMKASEDQVQHWFVMLNEMQIHRPAEYKKYC